MDLQQKKELRKYLLVRRLKKITKPIKIKTRIIKQDKANRVNLISLESSFNDFIDMKLIYKKKIKNGKTRAN